MHTQCTMDMSKCEVPNHHSNHLSGLPDFSSRTPQGHVACLQNNVGDFGVGRSTTTQTMSEEFSDSHSELETYSTPVTSPNAERTEPLTCKDSCAPGTGSPGLHSNESLQSTESILRSCAEPLPRLSHTVKKMRVGIEALDSLSANLATAQQFLADLDRELGQISMSSANASSRANRLRKSLKPCPVPTYRTTEDSKAFEDLWSTSPVWSTQTEYLCHHGCCGSGDPLAVERQDLRAVRQQASQSSGKWPTTIGSTPTISKKL